MQCDSGHVSNQNVVMLDENAAQTLLHFGGWKFETHSDNLRPLPSDCIWLQHCLLAIFNLSVKTKFSNLQIYPNSFPSNLHKESARSGRWSSGNLNEFLYLNKVISRNSLSFLIWKLSTLCVLLFFVCLIQMFSTRIFLSSGTIETFVVSHLGMFTRTEIPRRPPTTHRKHQ